MYGSISRSSILFNWLKCLSLYQNHAVFNHYCSVVKLEVRDHDSPSCSLIVKNCFCYSGFFAFPDEFENCSFHVFEELCWDWIYRLPLVGWLFLLCQSMSMGDLLRSSSLSFLRDLKLLSYRSFTCLVRVTPRYFILFVAIVMEVVSLISFSVCLSLV